MLADPAWTGAVAVTLPEELPIEETLELVPRLPRPPLFTVVNRSAARFISDAPRIRAPPVAGAAGSSHPAHALQLEGDLAMLREELVDRVRREQELRARLAGVVSLDDALLALDKPGPREVVLRLAEQLS
jgi:hypothetical protein